MRNTLGKRGDKRTPRQEDQNSLKNSSRAHRAQKHNGDKSVVNVRMLAQESKKALEVYWISLKKSKDDPERRVPHYQT